VFTNMQVAATCSGRYIVPINASASHSSKALNILATAMVQHLMLHQSATAAHLTHAMCALPTTPNTAHYPMQIGVKDALVLSPTLMPGTGPVSGTSTSTGLGVSALATSARMVLSAACGAQHTVLVTHSGGVLVCGRNRYYTALC
jgi:hypothetical protein